LRSDREHCASRVAVEQEERRGEEERRRGEERRGEEEQATDIKSNNPHLAGGEIWKTIWLLAISEVWRCAEAPRYMLSPFSVPTAPCQARLVRKQCMIQHFQLDDT